MILGLPPFWETFMRFPCCWVFIGGYTNKLPSKIGDWTKLDGRNSKTCFLHPQDHSTLSQGFRWFFLLHCHRWLSHFQVNVGNPMGIPRSYGLWWSQYGWYHRPAFRTFLKCSAEYLHPNVKTPKVLTCQSGWYRYNMLQPTSICWLNPDVRTSEIYPILVGYVPFFCGKIMQHHVKSPCWYCIQLTSTFLPSPSHSSTPPMDGSTEWRPSRQWSRTPGIYKKAGVNDLPCYQVPLNMNIYIYIIFMICIATSA